MGNRRGSWLPVLLGVGACLWGGGGGPPDEPVSDLALVELAERAGSFYALLEGQRLDARNTYEDAELRGYFVDVRSFTDYYAVLAGRLRDANFRHSTPETVLVRAYRLEGDESALVDVVLIGRHERSLMFWDLELEFSDVWRRQGGTWFLAPGKL